MTDKNFKTRLRELRKSRKLKQQDVADVLGYRYTAIANYESGRNEPKVTDLKKLAKFFDVSVDYLIGMSDIKNPYKQTVHNMEDGVVV